MKKRIGIVGEGPTDYLVLKCMIDQITGEENDYLRIQPEQNMLGEYGNGWKGVWNWCESTGQNLDKIMKGISPQIDMIVIQMDGDVAVVHYLFCFFLVFPLFSASKSGSAETSSDTFGIAVSPRGTSLRRTIGSFLGPGTNGIPCNLNCCCCFVYRSYLVIS